MSKILVIDSGIGGLSIVEEIDKLTPGQQCIYFADSAVLPYGKLDQELLVKRLTQLTIFLNERFSPDIIVTACNTASTAALPTLRANINTPIIGVVPAIKPAAALSQTGVIGLLATEATVQREYTRKLAADFAEGKKLLSVGSNALVSYVEHQLFNEKTAFDFNTLQHAFHQHKLAETMDTMVLGCTHFPLILSQLQPYFPNVKYWVDSGNAIARRVQSFIINCPPTSAHKRLMISTEKNYFSRDISHTLVSQRFDEFAWFDIQSQTLLSM